MGFGTTVRLRKPLLVMLMLAACLAISGCTPPVLTGLDVASGPERTLVMAQGSNLVFSKVVWDAGLSSEQVIPGAFLGGYMFSVPPGAAVGSHPVVLANSGGRSAKIDFNVTAPQPYGAPRIDAVTIVGASFETSAQVSTGLYVQGANIDVGAVVLINGTEVATAAHKGLRNDLYGIAPAALGYPIYHYVSLLALAGTQPVGSTLSITVRNLDGKLSSPFSYTLPADAATLDSDGDDLPDAWETAGYDADGDGAIDVNLPALGAHPYRRDIFLEVDQMTGLTYPIIATTPGNPGTLDLAKAVFAAAPILNPFTDNGINLVIDGSGTVPYFQFVDFNATHDPALGTAKFSQLKKDYFDAKRGRIFHYAIWAHDSKCDCSGWSDIDVDANGQFHGPGDDFYVSLGDFGASFHTLRSQVESLVHELGHDLGQRHNGAGGGSGFMPNYLSVMTYSWQLRTGRDNTWRKKRMTCLPAYYAAAGATEPGGALPSAINTVVDYSEGMAATLNENNLNESAGVCGAAVDWDRDGNAGATGVKADIDENGSKTDTLTDFANWRALDFRGPRMKGLSP